MKILSFLIFFILISFSLSAQDLKDLDPPLKQDTVNLLGVLYTCKGVPAPNVIVESSGTFGKNTRVRVGTVTDENGLFALNGIMVNDTLTIFSIKYNELHYYNKGSRLLVIYLPPEKIKDLNSASPIQVTAKRLTPKIIPSSEYLPSQSTTYYVSMEPEFPGGNENFIKYITAKIHYPDGAIKNNIEGTVEISFTVEKDGTPNNVNILKGIGYGCEDEVVKAIIHCPHWRPGIMIHQAATANVSVSVKFSLTDN